MPFKVTFIIVKAHKFTTKLMQAVDMFEQFKVHATITTISVDYKEHETVDYERAAKLIPVIVDAIKQADEIPVLVHLQKIENEDTILLNRSFKVPCYRDENIKVISTGEHWYLLDDFIKTLTK